MTIIIIIIIITVATMKVMMEMTTMMMKIHNANNLTQKCESVVWLVRRQEVEQVVMQTSKQLRNSDLWVFSWG